MSNFISNYFLASNTCKGFFSLFDELYFPEEGWFCYILKGGPGTGKSTIMKKLASEAEKRNIKTEAIHCSSDPDSLDAVIFPELKKCVADGTAPHVIEPKYPGVCEKIINLGDCWDEKKLKSNSKTLLRLFSENAEFHKKSSMYLNTLGHILSSRNKVVERIIENDKLQKFSHNFSKGIFKNAKICDNFKIKNRFLDAVTPKGHIFFEESIMSSAKNIYIIEDKYHTTANRILSHLKSEAIDKKISITSFLSPLSPKSDLRAILINETSTIVIAKNTENEMKFLKSAKCYKKINAKRFLNPEALKSHKNILNAYSKIYAQLLHETTNYLSKALENHDEIEDIYINSMNYKKVNKIADKLISAIF